ncbi:ubiquinol-cytochrome-c reductase complex assembly factor 1 [Belonocnema kinseyi]|uniref:ubiquinol-cytochrome-c reductase complex assembly factor 1 n=1 Tax=Belonocnema kinseyi TaxID=2817044 RepID=UPI00143D42C7|nr:ubiquinol-cytochrome-c reductase complex assembly factor 1 [Belonocnema kinseyi]
MHRIRIIPVKPILMPTMKNYLNQGSANLLELVTPTCALVVCSTRNLHSTRPFYTSANRTLNFPGVIAQKIRSTMSFFNPNKYRLKATGSFLYEEIADTIDYNLFYKEFSMPDTFYSWFVITELHVWMLMVRCMSEGVDGQIVRNSIVQAMWDDVNQRTKKLETADTKVIASVVRKQVQLLSEQFNACIIAYDEGITGDDKVLAAALWRRFLQSEGNDPVKLEQLVHYVRKQVYILDKITWSELITKRSITWQGLDLLQPN